MTNVLIISTILGLGVAVYLVMFTLIIALLFSE